MTYTDSSGRPEIVADSEFRLGFASWRIDSVPAAADVARPDETAGAGSS